MAEKKDKKCPGCGKLIWRRSKTCHKCAGSWRAAVEAKTDWASEPCSKCGRWPLSIFNTSGVCRVCSRYERKAA